MLLEIEFPEGAWAPFYIYFITVMSVLESAWEFFLIRFYCQIKKVPDASYLIYFEASKNSL